MVAAVSVRPRIRMSASSSWASTAALIRATASARSTPPPPQRREILPLIGTLRCCNVHQAGRRFHNARKCSRSIGTDACPLRPWSDRESLKNPYRDSEIYGHSLISRSPKRFKQGAMESFRGSIEHIARRRCCSAARFQPPIGGDNERWSVAEPAGAPLDLATRRAASGPLDASQEESSGNMDC